MRPKREFVLNREGSVLSSGLARYDTIPEYIAQFGLPTSGLTNARTFVDPIYPEVFILVVGRGSK